MASWHAQAMRCSHLYRCAWLLPLLLCVTAAGSSFAELRPDGKGGAIASPGGAATLAVTRYLERERSLEAALAKRDAAAVRQMLAADFQAQTAGNMDAPNPEVWMQGEFASPTDARQVRDMAVRQAEGLDVVSFTLQGSRAGYFVVDLWRTTDSKLLMRLATHTPRKPGALPHNTQVPLNRPDGR